MQISFYIQYRNCKFVPTENIQVYRIHFAYTFNYRYIVIDKLYFFICLICCVSFYSANGHRFNQLVFQSGQSCLSTRVSGEHRQGDAGFLREVALSMQWYSGRLAPLQCPIYQVSYISLSLSTHYSNECPTTDHKTIAYDIGWLISKFYEWILKICGIYLVILQ